MGTIESPLTKPVASDGLFAAQRLGSFRARPFVFVRSISARIRGVVRALAWTWLVRENWRASALL